jgi:hypothetical protein
MPAMAAHVVMGTARAMNVFAAVSTRGKMAGGKARRVVPSPGSDLSQYRS